MEVMVLNTSFEIIDIIEDFQSFIWVDRFDDCGDVDLYLPIGSSIPSSLVFDNYIQISGSKHLMIIEGLLIESDAEDGKFLTVTGRSLESILDRRIVWGEKIISGNLQEAIKLLITECFISPSITERRLDGFIFKQSTDPKVTALTVEETRLEGDSLLSVIKSLCTLNKLGFRVLLNSDLKFEFELYFGVDRSYGQDANPYVVFSPGFENLLESNYISSCAEHKNVVLVGGSGQGGSRLKASVGSASGLLRREVFVSSSEDSTALLESKGKDTLKDLEITSAFEGEIDTVLFRYGRDFFIGDTIQFINEYGHEGRSFVSEMVFSMDESGFKSHPTLKEV